MKHSLHLGRYKTCKSCQRYKRRLAEYHYWRFTGEKVRFVELLK